MKIKIRRIIQTLILCGVLFGIFRLTFPIKIPFIAPHFEPLLNIFTSITVKHISINLLKSLPLIILAILLGRFFCGFICPLGTLLDISDNFIKHKKLKNKDNKISSNVKYILLSAITITSIFGLQTYGFFSPMTIFIRTITTTFFAPINMLLKKVAEYTDLYAYSDSKFVEKLFTPLSDMFNKLGVNMTPELYFKGSLIFLVIFVGIVFLNTYTKRYWCRYLCPLGAFFGFLSKFNLTKRRVSDLCISCGACNNICPMNAIGKDYKSTNESDCIKCGECKDICPKNAVSFNSFIKSDVKVEKIDIAKREVLLGGLGGLLALGVLKVDPRTISPNQAPNKRNTSEYNLRPPNALPEADFVKTCIRCGLCVKVCPTNTLQFSLNEGASDSIWTPVLVPSCGVCNTECNACGQVCPTQAIRKFKIEDKKNIVIGHAIVDKNKCIAWGMGKHCAVCQEYCPYNAIDLEDHGVPCPKVNEKCVGCGACENACPVQPNAAIRVRL